MTKPDPHSVWFLVDAVAILFTRSYMLARTRAISHVSPMVRMLGLRNHAHSEAALLERELAAFQSHRRGRAPGRRTYFQTAAILDRYSRRLLALKAFRGSASTRDMLRIVRDSIRQTGTAPRLLVTDQGTQFRREFQDAVRLLGPTPVHCRVGGWQLNAKAERQFRTMKYWRRRAVLPLGRRALQRRLDAYRHWYNDLRPHAAHDALTPADAMALRQPPQPTARRLGAGRNREAATSPR